MVPRVRRRWLLTMRCCQGVRNADCGAVRPTARVWHGVVWGCSSTAADDLHSCCCCQKHGRAYRPPPQTPQCGGSEGSRGPLPLGKRHCSSRPYTGADHLILIQTCTSPGRGPYRVFCRGPKLEVMLLARNRPQADAVSRQTERLLPKTYSNRMFSQWCSQGGGAVGAAPPP